MKGKVLVTGATGRQGGATTKELLKRGWQVNALTRDKSKHSAKLLTETGATVVEGSMDNVDELTAAMSGCDSVFSVQNYWECGFTQEISQGKNVVLAAEQSGIKHLVYSSVTGAQMNTGIAHFDSKWIVEEFIRSRSVPYTILRPVCFMDSFLDFGFYKDGKLMVALPSECSLPVIASSDIGALAAVTIDKKDDFLNTVLEIAGDTMTMPEAASALSEWSGREVPFFEVPIAELKSQSIEMAEMFDWFAKSSYLPDLNYLRSLHPALKSFRDWLSEKQTAARSAGEK